MEPEKKKEGMSEPIFSKKQTLVLGISLIVSMLMNIYTVLLFGEELQWTTIAIIGINMIVILANAFLRATHTELIPDNSKVLILKKALQPLVRGFQRVMGTLYSDATTDAKMQLLETMITHFTREWDLANQGLDSDDFLSTINGLVSAFKEKKEKKKES